jgi:DNA-binding MarR family transcriptional regulator
METSSTDPIRLDQSQHSMEMVELVQRMWRLTGRFRVLVPENIVTLRKKIKTFEPGGKHGDFGGFEMFYRVGTIFAQHPEPMTMGEISHELVVPLSTATRMMDWLVSNSYAERLPDPKDRRVVRVKLTASGTKLYRTLQEFVVARLKVFMHRFTVEERETFIALLRKVVDAMEEGG